MIGHMKLGTETKALTPRNILRRMYRLFPKEVRLAARRLLQSIALLKLGRRVSHVFGKTHLEYSDDELVVICVVRNGSIYANSFIKHYFSLGAKHIVFLDNGSTDDTVKILCNYDNVTVLKTDAPYSKYENQMKEYLARRFSMGRWNLCADIDEFFDWPFSSTLKVGSLLRYLNDRGYTALVAQMLDLFSDTPLSQLNDSPQDDIVEKYKYYDISNITKTAYKHSNNSNDQIKMHWGGIRKTLFGTNNGLTKVPLVFVGPRIKLFQTRAAAGGGHHVENARLADFTSALLHCPFTRSFYEKVKDAYVTKRYGYITSDEYDMYWRRLRENPNLSFRLETSQRYAGIESLLEEGFLMVSADYLDWVRAHRGD
jgi:hypothetical protein